MYSPAFACLPACLLFIARAAIRSFLEIVFVCVCVFLGSLSLARWRGCCVMLCVVRVCREDDHSDEERNRNAEDKETEIMEDLAMAQAMEPKNDVSTGKRLLSFFFFFG